MEISCCPVAVKLGVQPYIFAVHLKSFRVEVYRLLSFSLFIFILEVSKLMLTQMEISCCPVAVKLGVQLYIFAVHLKQKLMYYSSWIYFVGIVFHFPIAKLGLDFK